MSDKARRTYTLPIRFSNGEKPSAAKLNGISNQSRTALSLIESMIGDIWNQGGDPILSPGGSFTANALHIPNIARSIGKLSLLNSMLPGTTNPISTTMIYNDNLSTSFIGLNRGFLKYKPFNTPSVSNITLSGLFNPIVQGQFKSDPTDVLVTGDWSVDATGKFFSFDSVPSELILQYIPDVKSDVADLTGNSSAWNVIPDPTSWSGNYAGVKISLANNVDTSTGYHIWLPPRKSLDSSKTLPSSPVTTNNTATDPESGVLLFFQNSSSNAAVSNVTNANHYRYNLPGEITSFGGPNDTLPSGFLYIWDEETGTIIEGLTYFIPGDSSHRKFKFRVVGANAITVFGSTIGNGIVTNDSTQLATDYKSRFKVITIGSSVTKTLSYLNKNFWGHSHKSDEGGNPVAHADLNGLVTPGYNSTYNSSYPSGVHSFTKSSWGADDHPQYLHRGGSTLSGGTSRDPDDNALYNRLIIKSPYGAGNTRSLLISVDDSGANASLAATATTALLLSGASNAAVNLINTQVSNRLFFLDAGTSPNISSNYIDYFGGTYSFRKNGFAAQSIIEAGRVSTSIDVTSALVYGTNTKSAGDSNATTRLGSFTYDSPRYQYLHIYPEDIKDPSDTVEFIQGQYAFNNSANVITILIPLKFPNGAQVSSGTFVKTWTTGNGVDGVAVFIGNVAKPASGTFASWSSVAMLPLYDTNSTTTNTVSSNSSWNASYTIDNGLNGNAYYLTLIFPAKVSTFQPKFFGLTIQYRMSAVDN